MRIYSLIIIAITIILDLHSILKEDKKNARVSAFISFLLYVPVFIYLIKH